MENKDIIIYKSNIFKEGEVEKEVVCKDSLHITQLCLRRRPTWITPCKRSAARGKENTRHLHNLVGVEHQSLIIVEHLRRSGLHDTLFTPSRATLARGYQKLVSYGDNRQIYNGNGANPSRRAMPYAIDNQSFSPYLKSIKNYELKPLNF